MNERQAEPPIDKPPLGVTPKYLWDEKRMLDLIGAIIRFTEAKEPVPSELSKELADLLTLYQNFSHVLGDVFFWSAF